MAAEACELLGTGQVLGCGAESIVGTGCEVEGEPALSLWLARWPGASITPMHLQFERTPEGGALNGWPDGIVGDWPEGAFLLLLGEPFTFPTDFLLERMNEDRPGVPVTGGMASGSHEPGGNRLILGERVLTEGAVAALVSGPVRLRTVVSQGCRPIGKPLVVTKAERNVIFELGGRPALVQLREIFDALPTREQRLVQTALHVGRVVSEYQSASSRAIFWSATLWESIRTPARWRSATTFALARPCSSTFATRKPPTPSSSSSWPPPRGNPRRRSAACSSPVTAAARECSASRTTTPKPSAGPSARCRWRAFSRPAKSAHRPAEFRPRLHGQRRAV
jgi:hypothetical protein